MFPSIDSETHTPMEFQQLVIAIIGGTGAVAVLTWSRALTAGGSLVTVFMALILIAGGGYIWLVPAVTFFVLSSVWTRWPGGADRKKAPRNSWQVLANGGVAALGGILALLGFADIGRLIVTGSFAAAAADTWSTEWGRPLGGHPLSLRTFRQSEPGRSGAISFVGTVASLSGAASVALASFAVDILSGKETILIFLAGAWGGLIDSLAGAWVQGVWENSDGSITEHKQPGTSEQRLVQGVAWIDNNAINLICTIAGATGAIGLMLIF